MPAPLVRSRASSTDAALISVAFGTGVVGVYLAAGLLFADWSFYAFLGRLSPIGLGYFVGLAVLVVAVFGVPVLAFLRFDLTAPLVILSLVILGWLAIGAVQGVISLESVFRLARYAATFSPVYLALYGVLGGGEYLLRGGTGTLSPIR